MNEYLLELRVDLINLFYLRYDACTKPFIPQLAQCLPCITQRFRSEDERDEHKGCT